MKIVKFTVRNFKSLGDVVFDWDDIVFLIGENNTGKSSILQALEVFLSGKQIKDTTLFRNELCDSENAIELTAHFSDLSEAERNATAVQGRMMGDEWILKKSFWLEHDNGSEKWRECYWSFHEEEDFDEWPENQRSWNNWPEIYNDLIAEVRAEFGGNRVTTDAIESLKQKVRENRPELLSTKQDWVENPGGGGNWKSNANSIIPEFVFVQAVQEASSETRAKEASTYGKIISLLIQRQLSQRPEFIELNQQIERVKALFTPNPAHPEWTQATEIERLQADITAKLSEIIDAQARIETTELDIRTVIMPATVLKIDDGFLTAVDDQGHGLQRTLLITLFQVLSQYSRTDRDTRREGVDPQSVVFGIEEPELYLHPQMIRKIRDVLIDLATDPGYQVICPTHSPVLLDMTDRHRSIVRLQKNATRDVHVAQVEDDIFSTVEEERDLVRMISTFDASVNELFFAKRVVLVEGDTEVAIFQKAADLLGLFDNPLEKLDTTFINCHGKSSMPFFMKVLNHFKIPYVVVHDVDRQGDGTNQVIADSATEGVQILTFDKDLESVLGYSSGKDKPFKALQRLDELLTRGTLPPDFISKVRVAYDVEPDNTD